MTRLSATKFLQKSALDHLLGIASWTMPATYLGLSTSNPGEDGSITGEPTGGSYARQLLAAKMGATVLATGVATSASLLQFPIFSADLGTATYVFVADALTGGNVLFYGELTEAIALLSGDFPVEFQPGDLEISIEDGSLTNYARKAILDHALGKTALPMPIEVFLALFTANPTASGSFVNEATYGSYARVSITSLMAATVLATGIAVNNAEIAFAASTLGSEIISYVGVVDDGGTSEELLFYSPLRRAFIVNSGGQAPVFKANRLGFRMQ